MPVIEIKPDVYWVGVNDRTTDLFESMWPITGEGVAYNAYLLRDEKKAIIDTVKSFKAHEFLQHVEELAGISQIDYVIINHMEPDHSGTLQVLKRIAPQVTFVGTQKTKEELEAFYGIRENVKVVQDGETLSLGRRTLRFISTPMVHWPETMMTYETTHGVLFSGDGFGGFGAHQGGIFDDECADIDHSVRETLRYFTNIVAKVSPMVLKAIEKLADTPITIVAPSHGIVWRRDPSRIVDLYRRSGVLKGNLRRSLRLRGGSWLIPLNLWDNPPRTTLKRERNWGRCSLRSFKGLDYNAVALTSLNIGGNRAFIGFIMRIRRKHDMRKGGCLFRCSCKKRFA
jgi:anaerobic nitric oxide reductase flavorubredoxin